MLARLLLLCRVASLQPFDNDHGGEITTNVPLTAISTENGTPLINDKDIAMPNSTDDPIQFYNESVSFLNENGNTHSATPIENSTTIEKNNFSTPTMSDKLESIDNDTMGYPDDSLNMTTGFDKIHDSAFYNESDYPFYYDEGDFERQMIEHSIWVTSVPGVICNSITIAIVIKMKPFTTASVFMLVLGVTDLVNVVMRICSALIYSLGVVTNITCKLVDYVVIAAFNYSNMILVIWTVERFVAVQFPYKCQRLCTIRNTVIALIVAGIILGLLALPYPVTGVARQTEFGFVECSYSEFMYSIWNPFETIYYIWIPMIVIFTLNALIILGLRRRKSDSIQNTMQIENAKKREREQRQITTVLLGVSLTFFLLHLPQAFAIIYLSIQSGKLEAMMADPFGPLKSLIWCFIVTEFQNSINFFLYCLTGRKFRRHVLAMFCCKEKDSGNGSTTLPSKSSSMKKY